MKNQIHHDQDEDTIFVATSSQVIKVSPVFVFDKNVIEEEKKN